MSTGTALTDVAVVGLKGFEAACFVLAAAANGTFVTKNSEAVSDEAESQKL